MTNSTTDEILTLNANELDGWRWSLECAQNEAFLLSDLISEITEPSATAVALDEITPETFRLHAYYLNQPDQQKITSALKLMGYNSHALANAEIAPIIKKDWVARSQKNLAPIEAGCFIVHGSHDRENISHRTRRAIEIDAAEAFGTAHHSTTRGCLLVLDQFLKSNSPKHVLDLGTGTGILAIAAAKGAQSAKIIATDIDPVATRTARTNCRLNNVNNQIEVLTCPGFGHPELRHAQPFDLIIANILAEPLKQLSPYFRKKLAPNGILILSGILNTQAKSVRATFRAQGLIDCAQIEDGEWSILTMQI